ncbi:uncharacterized protein FOMMEDRAFT_157567 [Fomitiporia mediterranea MF3/22]|uniref:uncharacterized protein n=1 Tax=Fomitiporia mediterranea (strain MF3/22) TaxID=694068 RepID=UPI0004409543|nr:uncharacterized protein FOMMEDRAFT_157567 [Fomitiporia mediterranea MF3/22]EJD02353.1 hypothetical protein FOMMEDRAFT_157567 [Fomitiporia mediterranea MF3/22]
MPYETSSLTESPMNTQQVHQLPVGPPPTPTPVPQPSPPSTAFNTLELHIPIPIPTPPTPLPIVVAYPLSETLVSSDHGHTPQFMCDVIQREDSGLALDPVPAPMQAQRSAAELTMESDETLHDPLALDNDYELLEMSEEERLDAQTVRLFRALNVPLNVHRLRAIRAKGKLPAPFLKFKYGTSRAKPSSHVPVLDEHADPHGNEPTDMERVEGESWYLPSASARRMIRRRTRREQPTEEHDARRVHPIEINVTNDQALPGPRPIIHNMTILDQFPLPPTSPPVPTPQPNPYTIPLPPTPSPSITPSSSSRPLGYMYAPAKPLRRAPSCKSCGGGGSSPANSVPISCALTPVPPLGKGQGPGCYYAYDLLTPSPGAIPYSGTGYARSVSPKRSASVSPVPITPQHFS